MRIEKHARKYNEPIVGGGPINSYIPDIQTFDVVSLHVEFCKPPWFGVVLYN